MSDKNIEPRLRGAFDAAQIEALGQVMGEIRESAVTQSQFERLEAMVQELLDRVPAPDEEVPVEDIVMIGAVVAHHLGRHVRVRGARRVRPAHSSSWAMNGRLALHRGRNLDAARR